MRTLVWFRGKDLRITDHAPLREALAQGEVIPLFVVDPFFFAKKNARQLPHRMQYLLESLSALSNNLESRGSQLICVRGKSLEVVPRLAHRLSVDQVFAHRWTEPLGRKRDERVQRALDVPLRLFEGETLLPPESVRTQSGTPYAVYTPFARAAKTMMPVHALLSAPREIPPPPPEARELAEALPDLNELGLSRNDRLQEGGERAARARMKTFFDESLADYDQRRDVLALDGTSRLSADLKFSTVSVATVYQKAVARSPSDSRDRFVAQLLWREFAYAILWDHPDMLTRPFRREFESFPWSYDEARWSAWAEGQTGYPVVDASARQLLTEGYVHNRARMISASFLTKHLLVHYSHGERHYLKYLTDGDWAVNNLGWQWSAGCGVDAQPYFRVFNPVLQGKRFDPKGDYVRRYLPQLQNLPNRYVHAPWEAPPDVLRKSGVRLGRDYPEPVVDHKTARSRFLDLAQVLKK